MRKKKQTQPRRHVQGGLSDQYDYLQQDIVSPDSHTFSSTLCGLRCFPLDRLRLQPLFVSCLLCFCFRYYKPMVPCWFIAGGYTKQQGGLDLLEDYFAILYV